MPRFDSSQRARATGPVTLHAPGRPRTAGGLRTPAAQRRAGHQRSPGARVSPLVRACAWLAAALGLLAGGTAVSAAPATPLGPSAALQGGRTGSPTVKVFLRNATVRVGEAAQLFVEVDGADRAEILSPPTAKGLSFEPVSGPSRRESYVITNGRQQRSVRLTFSTAARPTAKGTYEISPVRLRVDGREVSAPAEPLVLRVVEDLDASSMLLFTREELPKSIFEGEPYDIELRFGWDATLRAASVELSLPWWNLPDGVLEVKAPVGSARGQQGIFINRARTPEPADYLGQLTVNGQTFEAMRLRRRYIATRPGKLTFGQSVFEFSQLLRPGSVFEAATTREFYGTLPAFELEVRPIPEEGRPFEWTGAVGRFTADRSLDRRDVDVGDTIKLQVVWSGQGNLEFFEPPDLTRVAGFEGFRVLGVDDDRDPDRRRVVYDLVPLRAGDQTVPAVPLHVFDTHDERFVRIDTEPLTLRVRKVDGADDPFANLGAKADGSEPEVVLDIVDIDPTPKQGPDPAGPSAPLAFGALGALLVVWPFARRAVRRGGDPASASARRRRTARRGLARALQAAGTDPWRMSEALAEYLAARTGEPPAAWVGRDLREWRATAERRGAAGVPTEAALQGLVEVVRELDRARFAADRERPLAGQVAVDRGRVLEVVDALRGGLL
ncbi:MAG: BatD family protein [Planctomycetota bacterium]